MKKYKSHKVVEAAKITDFFLKGSSLFLGLGSNEGFTVSDSAKVRFKDISREDMGYLVRYEGGYISWSPTKAFEEGYTLLEEEAEVASKTLANTTASQAKANVKDIKFWGDGDMFKLLAKASSEKEGWMKSTKAMYTGTGCVVQVTTQQRNPDGSYEIAEALTFVPGVVILEYKNDEGIVTNRVLSSPDVLGDTSSNKYGAWSTTDLVLHYTADTEK